MPEIRSRRGRVPVSAMVLVVLILAAEGTMRLAAPRLPPILEWRDFVTQNKVAAMDRLAARGGASVVVVGASDVEAGVDATLATRLLGASRPVFNAAVNGAAPQTLELWTTGVVVPRLRPDVVVIGVNVATANDNNQGRPFELFRNKPGWRRVSREGSTKQKIEDRFVEWSYLIRYRTLFRRPMDFFHRGEILAQNPVGPLGTDLMVQARYDRTYRITRGFRIRMTNLYRDYSVGGRQIRALRRLVDQLHAKGIKVLLAETPFTPDETPLIPGGERDVARFKALMADFAANEPARYVDIGEQFGDNLAEFVDPHHLNLLDKKRYTEMLTVAIRALISG